MIEFKSNTPNYYNEKIGDKSNTVRVLKDDDVRKDIIDKMIARGRYYKIRIIHKQLLKETFVRQISDITKYRGLYIISWRHENNPPHPKEEW